jgi:3'-phosphoadenosine 5'-phosphosulfate sulfotransferase (PAPS reductase)/FAD synthetase
LNLDIGVYFAEKWKLSTDYDLNIRQKTIDFQDNLTNQLWNARLQRTFKNDEFTAYFYGTRYFESKHRHSKKCLSKYYKPGTK